MDIQAQIDAIDAGIMQSGGAIRVRFRDREVEYQSLADLMKYRALLEARLGSNQPYRLAQSSKMGWGSGE